jgi:integrase
VSRRGRRVRLDTGIYQDNIGFSIVAKIGGEQREKRLDAQPTQAKRQAWIEELTEKLPTATAGTLAGDFDDYLKTLPAKSRRKADARDSLAPWRDLIGHRSRKTVTSMDLRAILSTWRGEGSAASTLNHRRQELSNVYTALNGKAGANPVRDVPRVPERRDEPRGIPPAIVRLILAELPPGKTRLRLAVIAATGLPHIQVGRLHARDFHKAQRTLYVRPRRKGDGVPGVTLPLTKEATAALAAMFRGKAQGKFSNSSMWKLFGHAVEAARKKWQKANRRKAWPAPEGLRPYDLRHAFLTEAYRRTRDLRAVAELALHSDLRTTQRYAEAAVSETARRAIDQMDRES